jgi:PKD repeat protein
MSASFSATVKGRDLYVDASGSSLTGTITDWHWDFGDGTESCGETCSHTYLGQETSFTVSLTVTDDAGNTDTTTDDVTPGGAVYVATDGTSGGDGSIDDPYDLVSVFDPPGSQVIGAGQTAWLRGGTYDADTIIGDGGFIQVWFGGSSGNPAVARGVPGERVRIRGPVLQRGDYSELRDVECFHDDPLTATNTAGFALHAVGGRAINLVVHDAPKSGVFLKESDAGDQLADGLILYNNGTTDNLDHALYCWNPSTSNSRTVQGCLAFNNWAFGFHAFTENSGQLHDLAFIDCVSWLNGAIGGDGYHADFIISGTGASDITYQRCRSWHQAGASYPYTAWIGDEDTDDGNAGLLYDDNYFVGTVQKADDWTDETGSGTVVVDPSDPPTTGQLTYLRVSPEAPGIGWASVYNWSGAATCALDVSTLLRRGDGYEVHHVHDLYGDAVLSGTWDGTSTLALPMDEVLAPDPVGRTFTTPDSPGTAFHVFVIQRTSQSYVAPDTDTTTGLEVTPRNRWHR